MKSNNRNKVFVHEEYFVVFFSGDLIYLRFIFEELNMKKVLRVELEQSPPVNNFSQPPEGRDSCKL